MNKQANYSHAWRGCWERPMKIDENALHPFTVARMTDHNVRGMDRDAETSVTTYHSQMEPMVLDLDTEMMEAEVNRQDLY